MPSKASPYAGMSYDQALNNLSAADKVWLECLKLLKEFGYQNIDKNIALAHQYKGQVDPILDELVSANSKEADFPNI